MWLMPRVSALRILASILLRSWFVSCRCAGISSLLDIARLVVDHVYHVCRSLRLMLGSDAWSEETHLRGDLILTAVPSLG